MTPAELAKLHAASFPNSRSWSAKEFESLLSSPHCFSVTESMGFALGRVIADEAELLTIAVDPRSRRSGLGTKLMQKFETAAKDRGASHAFLEVSEDNTAAKNLYFSFGYAEISRRKDYYTAKSGKTSDALILNHLFENNL